MEDEANDTMRNRVHAYVNGIKIFVNTLREYNQLDLSNDFINVCFTTHQLFVKMQLEDGEDALNKLMANMNTLYAQVGLNLRDTYIHVNDSFEEENLKAHVFGIKDQKQSPRSYQNINQLSEEDVRSEFNSLNIHIQYVFWRCALLEARKSSAKCLNDWREGNKALHALYKGKSDSIKTVMERSGECNIGLFQRIQM